MPAQTIGQNLAFINWTVLTGLALGSFAGTSLTLAVDVWVWHRIFAVPTALAVLGVMLMLGACVRLVMEALDALRGNDREIQFYRDLRAQRGSP